MADIATADGTCISFQAYNGVNSNGLCKNILLPEALTKEEVC